MKLAAEVVGRYRRFRAEGRRAAEAFGAACLPQVEPLEWGAPSRGGVSFRAQWVEGFVSYVAEVVVDEHSSLDEWERLEWRLRVEGAPIGGAPREWRRLSVGDRGHVLWLWVGEDLRESALCRVARGESKGAAWRDSALALAGRVEWASDCGRGWDYVGVRVRAYVGGIELGSDSLWGIECDWGRAARDYLGEVARDCAWEARGQVVDRLKQLGEVAGRAVVGASINDEEGEENGC